MDLYHTAYPQSWSELVGNEMLISRLKAMAKRCGGYGGRAYWIRGRVGHGKTALARLIAAQIAADLFRTEKDASELTLDSLRRMQDDFRYYPFSGPGKVWICNEANGIRREVGRRLLTILDQPLKKSTAIIFTSTKEGFEDKHLDAKAFMSRVMVLRLAHRDIVAPFAKRCRTIAKEQGLENGQPLKEYEKLVRASKCNMREVFQWINDGVMLQAPKIAT